MFFISALLLCLSLGLHAAQPLSGTNISVQGKNDTTSLEVPVEYATTYFVTLQNLVNDLGNKTTIPLLRVTNNTFRFFAEFARNLLENDNDLEKLEKKFNSVMDETPISYADLLDAANYLDFNIKTHIIDPKTNKKTTETVRGANVLARWYAKIFETRGLNPIKDSDEEIGESALKLVAPGWLLHDLLSTDQGNMKTEKIQFNPIGHLYSAQISNSSTQGNFVYLETVDESTTNYFSFDLGKKTIKKHDPLPINIGAHSGCAISSNEHYLLITEDSKSFKKPNYKIKLFHIKDKNKSAEYNLQIDNFKTENFSENINTVRKPIILYNDSTQSFHIIVSADGFRNYYSKFVMGSPFNKLLFYEIDPNNTTEFVKPTFIYNNYSEQIHWNCVGENLIGISRPLKPGRLYNDKTNYNVMLYNGKNIFECTYNSEYKTWRYQPDKDGEIIDAPFTLIISENLLPSTIIKSFIPNLDVILVDSINAMGKPEKYRFDSQNLCVNFYDRGPEKTIPANPLKGRWTIGFSQDQFLGRRGFDPKLTAAIQFIHHTVASPQTTINKKQNVLENCYFLYHYYVHPNEWQSFCAPIWRDVSPEIKTIYGLEHDRLTITGTTEIKKYKEALKYKPIFRLQPTKPKPQSWLEYTKQQLQTYKTQILGGLAVVASGAGLAWLWKHGKNAPSVKATTPAPNPIRPANRTSTFVAPAGR